MAAVALASDLEGVLAAEALAYEVVTWANGVVADRVVWRFGRTTDAVPYGLWHTREPGEDNVRAAWKAIGAVRDLGYTLDRALPDELVLVCPELAS
jgi:hypothetical protein